MNRIRTFLLSLLIFTCTILQELLFAQNAEVRGFVYEKETSEPVIYTSVILRGTSFGAQTNLDGFFSITRVPPGSYTITVTSVGFDTLRMPITLNAGEIMTKKLYLAKSAIEMQEVQVSAESQEKKTDVQVSVTKITPKDIRQIPTIGGEPDLAQYLQVLPGVIFSGDQGGQLYIRGGTPIQNKVLLDGMIVYNPIHSIGLYTVFDADLIRGADIYTGGFNAEYGDRVSSIMDITTRDGNKKYISGKVGVNTFTSKVLLEGPMKKETEGQDGSSSFILDFRKCYLNQTSGSLYKNFLDTAGLPFSFTDLYGKMSFNSAMGSKFNVFGFHSGDDVDYSNLANIGWNANGFGTNFVLVPSGSSVLIEGNFAWSKYKINMIESDDRERRSEIKGFNTGLNFKYFLGKDELNYGIEILGFGTDYLFSNVIGTPIEQQNNTTEFGFFLKYKKIVGKLIAEPGIRLNYYTPLSEFSPEPRLGLKFNVSDHFRLKAAGGLYSQDLLAANSDRDVVNLFYGFLAGSDELPNEFHGEKITGRLQKASHVIAGFEWDLPMHFALNVEGYYKNFSQLENINRSKLYPDDADHFDKPDSLKKDFIIERGFAKGVDFLLKYDYRQLYLWMVYSLSYVQRNDENQTYQPSFDRRHNVNLVASYVFGKNKKWQANARWNLGSPFPFTQSQNYYENVQMPDGIGTDILNQNGNMGTAYGALNGGRLSWFHRLDISLQKNFRFSKQATLDVTASVSNVYDRKNIFYVNRITGEKIYQLPMLPSLGVTFSF